MTTTALERLQDYSDALRHLRACESVKARLIRAREVETDPERLALLERGLITIADRITTARQSADTIGATL